MVWLDGYGAVPKETLAELHVEESVLVSDAIKTTLQSYKNGLVSLEQAENTLYNLFMEG